MYWSRSGPTLHDIPQLFHLVREGLQGLAGWTSTSSTHVYVKEMQTLGLRVAVGYRNFCRLRSSSYSILTRANDTPLQPTVFLGTWTEKLKRWRSQGQDGNAEVMIIFLTIKVATQIFLELSREARFEIPGKGRQVCWREWDWSSFKIERRKNQRISGVFTNQLSGLYSIMII